MAILAPRHPHLRSNHGRRRTGAILAIAACLGLACAGAARAQVVIGGNTQPAVTVDLSVLDRLGPGSAGAQLSSHGTTPGKAPAATAHKARTTPSVAKSRSHKRMAARTTRSAHRASSKTARAKNSAPVRTAAVKTAAAKSTAPKIAVASAQDSAIHLKPPPSPNASKGGATSASRAPKPEPSASTATKSAIAALASPVPPPAPLPKLPEPAAVPATPNLPPAPPHVETAANAVAATAPAALPSSTPQPQATLAVTASPTPAPTAAPAATASTAPALSAGGTGPNPSAGTAFPARAPGGDAAAIQMAAATTAASALANVIRFPAGAADLPPGPQGPLDAVAARMLADDSLRVQVIAHATGNADQAMEARRVSLARAVAVRAYLIQKGVRSLRIDVRALGNRADDGPVTDQVNLVLVNQ